MSPNTDEFAPATPAELSRFLTENAAGPRTPFIPVGGRTSLQTGLPIRQPVRAIATTSLNQVIDYPARDLTITVEAGIRIAELQKVLQQEGQRLPIDIPDSGRATLGGAIATNTSGPHRLGHGTFRDYVIGLSAVDGQGRLFSSGGRVVKNVAGYDLCKLMVGSLGTLAVLTQVTLKLKPLAESRSLLWLTGNSSKDLQAALDRLRLSGTRPVVMEILNRRAASDILAEARLQLPNDEYSLAIGFEGTERECAWQIETVAQELASITGLKPTTVDAASTSTLLKAMGEYQTAGDDPVTFTASVPLSQVVTLCEQATQAGVAVQSHAGNGILVGHLPDSCVSAEAARDVIAALRSKAESVGGHLVLWTCETDWKPVVGVLGKTRPETRWMSEISKALDPHGVLSPGRLPV